MDEDSSDLLDDHLDNLAGVHVLPPTEEELLAENSGEGMLEVFRRKQIAFFSSTTGDVKEIGQRATSNLKLWCMTLHLLRLFFKHRKYTKTEFKKHLRDNYAGGKTVSLDGCHIQEAFPLCEYFLSCTTILNENADILAGGGDISKCKPEDPLVLRVIRALKRKGGSLAASKLKS